MKDITLNFYNRYSFTALVVVLTLWSCTTTATLEEEGLTLVNESEKPLAYLVVEAQTFNHIDIREKSKVEEGQENIIQPQQSATISKEKIVILDQYSSGKNMRLVLYDVVKDSMFYNNTLELNNKELAQRKFRVEINKDENSSFVISSSQ